MTVFLVRRFFQIITVLFLASAVIYTMFLIVPGGPLAELIQSTDNRGFPSLGDIERHKKMLGLDKPWYLGYPVWLAGDTWLDTIGQNQYLGDRKGIIRGDWGVSWRIQRSRPVLELIGDRLPATLWLMIASIMISLMIGIPLGVSAVRQSSVFDDIFTTFSVIGLAIPAFWFGLLLIAVSLTAKKMGWFSFPTHDILAIHDYTVPGLGVVEAGSFLDRVMHLAMPVMVLALLNLAGWSRFMRASMLEALSQDSVRTAHAVRKALVPLITLVVFAIPSVFNGVILTEDLFNYKGLGVLFLSALGSNDYPVVQAYLLITLILLVLTTVVADILSTFVGPRIRRD